MFWLQRRPAEERTLGRRATSSAPQHGRDSVLDGRKRRRDGRSVRRDEGAPGRNSGARRARSESRNSAHFPTSGSEVEVWNDRDTSGGGFERDDEGERAAAARERLLAVRAEG